LLCAAVLRPTFSLLLALTALVRLPGFFISLYSGDEATYSSLALRILRGALPYHGAVDHKPVGIELTYALVYGAFGTCDIRLVRALLVCAIAATGWLLGAMAARIGGRPEARWVGAIYVLLTVAGMPSDVQAANAELVLNLPLALAAWCALDRRWLAAGVLTALAGFFKYQAVLAGAAWLAIALLEPTPWRERLRHVARLALGFALPWAALFALFVATGTWEDFVFWGWRFNFRYMSLLTLAEKARNAFEGTALVAACWSPVLLCVWAGRKGLLRFPLLWLFAMLAAVIPGGRYFPHYYLVAAPPLCLLAWPGALELGPRKRQLAVAIGLLVICGSEIGAWSWYRIKPVLAKEAVACDAVGKYVRARSTPADTVFVWGASSHTYYYYLRRVMATRFAFNNYLTGRMWGTRSNDETNAVTDPYVVREAWPELMRDLEAARPRFIVDAATGATHLGMFDWHPISRFPELSRFVERNYDPPTLVAGVPIYRLRER
jgi:hypothetical protein